MTALHYRGGSWWSIKQPNGRIAYVPATPLNPTAFGPRILPEGNESVRTIRAIEAQIASLAPVKEIDP